MAAKVPDVRGQGYYVASPANTTVRTLSSGTAFGYVPNDVPGRLLYGFSDIDDGDTWTVSTSWRGPVPRAAWIPDTTGTIAGSAHATLSGTTLTVTFETASSNQLGFCELHLAGM